MPGNAQIIRELTDAWAAGNHKAAMAAVHPDVVIRQPLSLPWGGEHRGHEGMAKMFEIIGAELDQEMAPMVIEAWGDRVITYQDVRWIHRASEATVDVPRLEVVTVNDDMAAEFDVYYKDTYALMNLLAGGERRR